MFRENFLIIVGFASLLVFTNLNDAAESDSWIGKRIFVRKKDTRCYLTAQVEKREGTGVVASCYPILREERGRIAIASNMWFDKDDVVPISEAHEYFTSEIRHDQKNKYALTCRGIAYANVGELLKAHADYTEAIRLDPKDSLPYVLRGTIFAMKRDFDSALADFTEAIRLDPKDDLAYAGRGKLFMAMGEFSKALPDYEKAIHLEPATALYVEERGKLFLIMENYDRALADMNELVRLSPKNPDSFHLRGIVWHFKKEFDRAITDFDEAIRLDPSNAEYFFKRGSTRASKKEFKKALFDFEEAVRQNPEKAVYYRIRAHLLATCPDPKIRNGLRAIESARAACELTGWKDPYALSDLAASYAEISQFGDAIKWQTIAIEVAKDVKVDYDMEKANHCLKLYQTKKPYRDEGE